MIQRLLSVDAEDQVGEVRQTNGLRSMCLGERCYGGGCGTVWATPGETVDFTVVNGRTKGYLTGLCRSLVISCGTQQSELMVVVEPGGHVGRSLAGLSTCPRGGVDPRRR